MRKYMLVFISFVAALLLCACNKDLSTTSSGQLMNLASFQGEYTGYAFDSGGNVGADITLAIMRDSVNAGIHSMSGNITADGLHCLAGALQISSGTFDEQTGTGTIRAGGGNQPTAILAFQSHTPFNILVLRSGSLRIEDNRGQACFISDSFNLKRPTEEPE